MMTVARVLAWLVLVALCGELEGQTRQSFDDTLMPVPAKIVAGEGALRWDASFSVATVRYHDARLDDGLLRMLRRLEESTGEAVGKEIRRGARGATLVVDVTGAGEAVQSVREDEGYSLGVKSSEIRLQSATVVGAMRGMETLLELLQSSGEGFYFPAVRIEDAPRFRWRGLMIDCGRHFEPVAVLERMLDGMAAVKLNVFHWHLSEDQGFRMESKRFPKLTGMGSDGMFYTQDQAREIVAYARARGIRVVPEFDMPGHSRSWFVGYPELASGPADGGGAYTLRREFGIDDAAMDPTQESTYVFLDQFIGEMVGIFPDPYFHVGGDESNGKQWAANPKIRRFMRDHLLANAEALQAYFGQRVGAILARYGKRMAGWDEVLTPGLPKTTVVQSWRGVQSLEAGAKLGYEGILSQPYYLDAMRPAGALYLADPLPASSGLDAEARARVLGGEICMWAEQVDAASIDSRVWPRAAAVAERFWSGEGVRDVDDMYRRLAAQSLRLEALGLTHVSHEGQALRVLAGTTGSEPLRSFAELVEPVSFSERYEQQRTSQLTPLTNLVDAVRPDPPAKHEIEALVRDALGNGRKRAESRAALAKMLTGWVYLADGVMAEMNQTPVLRRAEPLAAQLPKLAAAGLEALRLLGGGEKAAAGWRQRQMTLLDESRQPGTLVRFVFLDALQQLIEAVPEQPSGASVDKHRAETGYSGGEHCDEAWLVFSIDPLAGSWMVAGAGAGCTALDEPAAERGRACGYGAAGAYAAREDSAGAWNRMGAAARG